MGQVVAMEEMRLMVIEPLDRVVERVGESRRESRRVATKRMRGHRRSAHY